MQELQLVKSEKFGEVQADIYSDDRDMFMTIDQLAKCLEYKTRRGLEMLLDRNLYLKSEEFSVTHKLCATDGKYYNTRIFNEDGIYEVTFLSKTDKAKEFRSWVRKILKSLRKGEMKLTSADNNISLSPIMIESIMQKYFDDTIKPEINSLRYELINGQKLLQTMLRRGLFPPVNTTAWKNEIYTMIDEIARLRPDKYKANSYVLSEFYKVMRDTYGFVEEQSMKEYKERHNTNSQVFTIDLIADDKQLRDIFKNLLTDYLSSLKSNVNPNTVSNLSPIEQLIEKRQDKSPYGVQTYKYVYKNMMSNRAWKCRITRYKNSNGVNSVSKPEIIKSNEQLQMLFINTVHQLLTN